MIKENNVLIKINIRNISYFIKRGYSLTLNDKDCLVSILDLSPGSKVKITAICEICSSETVISYNKYLVNKNRNNKGYYSCFSCKNIEKEKTCLEKYGVSSYSMTDEFRINESRKWKGIQKGGDKYKKTMYEKYGVTSYFKMDIIREKNKIWMSSDEFKSKSKDTMLLKYGVDHFSKTELFKSKISENKDCIIEKIKNTFLKNWGVDWYSKTEDFRNNMNINKDEIIKSIKKTCLEKYGYDNVSKVEKFKDKIKKSKIELGLVIPDELLSEWFLYRRDVRRLTNRYKKLLFELWDGFDYYDDEFIKGYLSNSHIHRYYPTVDHKISIYYGFINKISPEEISNMDNLCITKRYINSKKCSLNEKEFKYIFNI